VRLPRRPRRAALSDVTRPGRSPPTETENRAAGTTENGQPSPLRRFWLVLAHAGWLAWSLWALAIVLAALMVLFYLLSLSAWGEVPDRAPPWFVPLMALMLVSFSTVGAVIAARRPDNAVGWSLLTMGFALGVAFFGQAYADYTLVAHPGSLPGGAVAVWLSLWTPVLTLVAATFFCLLFPDGRPPSNRWRWVGRLASTGGVLLVVGLSLAPGTLDERNYPGAHNPVGVEGAGRLLEGTTTVGTALALVALLLAVLSMIVRFRRSIGVERQQLKWIVYAGAAAAGGFAFTLFLSGPLANAVFAVAFLAFIGVPVAAGFAILRYRLYDIDRIINRTLVYASLTAMLALVYFGGVAATQAIFQTLTGHRELPQLAIVVSTLVIAALFNPLRRRIQAFVDRRFYRRKYDAAKTLEAFNARLREETDLDALRDDLVGVVSASMQPEHVSLWLRPEMVQKAEQAD
jgi:ABC-type multidrug transport system fused ATPase/permease subunit